MEHSLPVIILSNRFDSNTMFSNLSVTAPRTVRYYELECYEDDGGISVINSDKFHRKSGVILLAKPGDVRYSYLPFTCKFIRFTVSDSLLISILDKMDNVFFTGSVKVKRLFDEISASFYSFNPLDKYTAGAKLLLLLQYLSNLTTEKDTVILKSQHFIENNYNSDITTGDIANHCSVSVSYLHRLFRKELDVTPYEYLLSRRLFAAKDMLVNTRLPLSDIAASCGFNSQSYFSDCFKRNTGVTPMEFRKGNSYLL